MWTAFLFFAFLLPCPTEASAWWFIAKIFATSLGLILLARFMGSPQCSRRMAA